MSDIIYQPYYRIKAVFLHAADFMEMSDMLAAVEAHTADPLTGLSDLSRQIVYPDKWE